MNLLQLKMEKKSTTTTTMKMVAQECPILLMEATSLVCDRSRNMVWVSDFSSNWIHDLAKDTTRRVTGLPYPLHSAGIQPFTGNFVVKWPFEPITSFFEVKPNDEEGAVKVDQATRLFSYESTMDSLDYDFHHNGSLYETNSREISMRDQHGRHLRASVSGDSNRMAILDRSLCPSSSASSMLLVSSLGRRDRMRTFTDQCQLIHDNHTLQEWTRDICVNLNGYLFSTLIQNNLILVYEPRCNFKELARHEFEQFHEISHLDVTPTNQLVVSTDLGITLIDCFF